MTTHDLTGDRAARPSLRPATAAALLLWSAGVLALLTAPDRTGLGVEPFRLIVVGGYLLVAPGLALTLVLGLRDRLTSAVVALTVSLSVLVLAAQAALYLGHWSPAGVTGTIVAGTAVPCVAVLVRSARSRRQR